MSYHASSSSGRPNQLQYSHTSSQMHPDQFKQQQHSSFNFHQGYQEVGSPLKVIQQHTINSDSLIQQQQQQSNQQFKVQGGQSLKQRSTSNNPVDQNRLRQDGIIRQQINGINSVQQHQRFFQAGNTGRHSGDQTALLNENQANIFSSPPSDIKKK